MPPLISHTHCQAAQASRTIQSLSISVSEPTHGQKRKSTIAQQCISVMRAERVKLSILAPKKLCGGWTVNRSETRTTLILGRYHQLSAIKRNHQLMFNKEEIRRLRDFNNYKGHYQGLSHELANKPIKKLTKKDISYLLRENKFTDTLLEISDKILEHEKIEVNVFHHPTNSDEQREIIRELIIIKDDYWDLYPHIYRSIKSKIEKHMAIIQLPGYIKEHFTNYEPKQIKWGIDENNWYKNMIHENAAFTVLAAYRRIGQLKRANKLETPIYLEAFGENVILNTEEAFNELFVDKLLNSEQLKEYIKDDNIVYSK